MIVDRPDVFENIDRLVQVELRPAGMPMGVIPQLYTLARGDGPPLSLTIAQRLLEPDVARVACVTGVVFDPLVHGEIDGPIGSAVLATALARLGKSTAVIAPAGMARVLAAVRAALNGEFDILADGEASADDFDAAVAIERLGRNRKGRHHTILGGPLELDPSADDLVAALNERGRLTVGLGDGGNEIGFGALFDDARRLVPRGVDCGCPCGDGIVTSTATELLFPVSVSNLGAHAVTAALGLLADRPTLLPSTAALESATLAAMAEGSLDGGTFRPGFMGDDGIPFETVAAIVGVLRGICTQAFRTTPRHA